MFSEGFILSIWLNSGAAKLQYLQTREMQTTSIAERNQVMQRWDADRTPEDDGNNINGDPRRRRRRRPEEEDGLMTMNDSKLVSKLQMTSQESILLRVLVFWSVILIYTSWLYPTSRNPSNFVGFIVNINLVAFYAGRSQQMIDR